MTTVIDNKGTELTIIGCGRCSACKTIKPADQFYRDGTRSSGLSSRCKECDAARMRLPSKRAERFIVTQLFALIESHPEPRYRRLIRSTVKSLAA